MNARDRYDSLFKYYAEKNGLDWLLLKAQGIQESLLNPEAKSRVGALGLMQFMPKTWQEWYDERVGIEGPPLARDERTNPEKSIAAGAAYLAYLLARFSRTDRALAAYNWGMGNVRRHLAQYRGLRPEHLPEETRRYIERILALRDRLAAGG